MNFVEAVLTGILGYAVLVGFWIPNILTRVTFAHRVIGVLNGMGLGFIAQRYSFFGTESAYRPELVIGGVLGTVAIECLLLAWALKVIEINFKRF